MGEAVMTLRRQADGAIGTLVAGYHAAREVGARFVLRNPSEFVHRQLRVTGLTELFGLTGAPSALRSYTT